MRITVIVTDEEHVEIKKMAGLVPLSAWFRSLAGLHRLTFGDGKGLSEQSEVGAQIEDHKPSLSELIRQEPNYTPLSRPRHSPRGRAKPCKHGMLFCKKCA